MKEFTLYQGGLLWGAVQGLFGMIPVIGAIPDVVQFLQFFEAKLGQSGFWSTIWEYLKAQWQSFASLFTQDQGQGSFARGQLLGNVLIGVIVSLIGVLMALVSAGATLEFTAVGILGCAAVSTMLHKIPRPFPALPSCERPGTRKAGGGGERAFGVSFP